MKHHDIDWHVKSYDELTKEDMYQLFKLRVQVFMIEQQCLYSEFDGHDDKAIHCLGWKDKQLVAYSRLFASGDYFPHHASFGRLAIDTTLRKKGVGKILLKQTMDIIHQRWPHESIKISAQHYLLDFYRKAGFQQEGDPYDEDGIPHIAMVYSGAV